MQTVSNHKLVGKHVDFDWRKPAEKTLPYNSSNKNVDQHLLVVDAYLDCYGDTWLRLEGRQIAQKEQRVCKVYK